MEEIRSDIPAHGPTVPVMLHLVLSCKFMLEAVFIA